VRPTSAAALSSWREPYQEPYIFTMQKRAVLFDLDGTLADTLADLASATNWALTQLGCPTHPREKYRHMVGDGARQLCARALPAEKQGLLDEAVRLMRDRYAEHWADETRLHPGRSEEHTSELQSRGHLVCR